MNGLLGYSRVLFGVTVVLLTAKLQNAEPTLFVTVVCIVMSAVAAWFLWSGARHRD